MLNGTVKFFNAAKGFGFITPDEGGKDVFVSATANGPENALNLKIGQRVSFEAKPDTKGPKAVNLKVLAEAPKVAKAPSREEPTSLAFYYDPADETSEEILAWLTSSGHAVRALDYIATPMSVDELKRLSLLLRGSDQSLVHRYDPLFMELRLDDRFISENEFWGGIVEHPSLISGPILVAGNRASICRSENAAQLFLGASSRNVPAAPKPKGIPDGLAKLLQGKPADRPVAEEKPVKKTEPVLAEKAPVRPAPVAVKKTVAAVKPKEKSQGKVAAKPAAKPKAKVAAKPAAKPKSTAKPAAKASKPAKKSRR